MSEAIPMIRVPSVWVLYPWEVSISPEFVTTQKYESFACETVIAPAPIATTTRAADTGVTNPMLCMIGAMIPALVVMATVEEP